MKTCRLLFSTLGENQAASLGEGHGASSSETFGENKMERLILPVLVENKLDMWKVVTTNRESEAPCPKRVGGGDDCSSHWIEALELDPLQT